MSSEYLKTRSFRAMDANPRVPACTNCQRHKVRCLIEDGKPPCRRCRHRKTSCEFKKSSSLNNVNVNMEDDDGMSLNAALIHDLKILHAAVAKLSENTSCPPLASLKFPVSSGPGRSMTFRAIEDDSETSPHAAAEHPAGHDNADIEAELLVAPSDASITESPTRLPIDSLFEITHLRSLRSRQVASTPPGATAEPQQQHSSTDIISKGIIPWSHADRLVKAYLARSDHYLYGIASKYKDVESIRWASPLLLTAICTVEALQDRTTSDIYRVCHAELLVLVSRFIFKPTVELEDLRGLCVACFWLSDISWSVSGIAIRRACEVDLQNSFYAIVPDAGGPGSTSSSDLAAPKKLPGPAVDCMRLWYLFYICDQHLSILYGRAPTMRDEEAIKNCESYLTAVPATSTDMRIVNQASLLRILSAVADTFGPNVERRVPIVFKTQLENFIRQLDGWVTNWLSYCATHPAIGDYPSKAVSLHFHFAKLHVCSHVFRGLSSDVESDPVPRAFHDIALMAIQSARSIVDLVVQEMDLKNAFIRGIHYFNNMVAHGCLFLLKCTMKYQRQFQIDVNDVLGKVEQIILLCKEVRCADYHVITWIGKGLQKLLSKCRAAFPPGFTAPLSNQEQMTRMSVGNTLNTASTIFATHHTQYDPTGSSTALELDSSRGAMSPQQALFDMGPHYQPGADFLDATTTTFRAGSTNYLGEGFGECAGEYGASQWNRLELGLGFL